MADPTDLAALFSRIDSASKRPTFSRQLVLIMGTLADHEGKLGPEITVGEGCYPVTEGLARILKCGTSHDGKAERSMDRIRGDIRLKAEQDGEELSDADLQKAVEEQYLAQSLKGMESNISRTMTELEDIGVIQRYYQGNFTAHHNRGAQRQAVYGLSQATRTALTRSPSLNQYSLA